MNLILEMHEHHDHRKHVSIKQYSSTHRVQKSTVIQTRRTERKPLVFCSWKSDMTVDTQVTFVDQSLVFCCETGRRWSDLWHANHVGHTQEKSLYAYSSCDEPHFYCHQHQLPCTCYQGLYCIQTPLYYKSQVGTHCTSMTEQLAESPIFWWE